MRRQTMMKQSLQQWVALCTTTMMMTVILLGASSLTSVLMAHAFSSPAVTTMKTIAAEGTPTIPTRLRSTMAPPETSTLTGFEDDGDSDDNVDLDGHQKHRQLHKRTSTTTASTKTSTIMDKTMMMSTDAPTPAKEKTANTGFTGRGGPLSMSLEELADELGGTGRARLVWDCYKIGIDPSCWHGDSIDLPFPEDYETVLQSLPSARRTQRLSQTTLAKVENLYRRAAGAAGGAAGGGGGGGSTTGTTTSPTTRIEGGVATLAKVSRSGRRRDDGGGDKTTKLLLTLQDGLQVECVIIPPRFTSSDNNNNSNEDDSARGMSSTVCLSSQVGCRQGCTFCATGRMGNVRSLSADEILAQMFFATKLVRLEELPPIGNVVFMGMGEPSDNAANVVQATKILTTRKLFQLSASRVTVSTVAPTPKSFMEFQDAPCVLAWSVHAANDELRRQLVPTTRHSMAELRQGLMDVLLTRPMNARTCMLEVALMKNVNDRLQHADELAEFTQVLVDQVPGVKPHINLIPYNDIGVAGGIISYERPDDADVRQFQKRLQSHGLHVHVRSTRGDDKTAACGQLATDSRRRRRESDNSDSDKNSQPKQMRP